MLLEQMNNEIKRQKIKKKSALLKHIDNECGCSIFSNPNNCIYQSFLDDWSFTPDVGNGQSRGEVFTPRFIVDKMITDVGIFPKEAVYEQDYTTLPKNEIEKIICSKVLEPAVGTGNYISTVLWHKLMFVEQFSKNSKNTIDVDVYNENLLKAVSSIYTFDIDCGNLETTYQRLFNDGSKINAQNRIDYWTDNLDKSIVEDLSNIDVEKIVTDSLNLAESHWSKFTNASQGIIPKLYEQHIGASIPQNIKEKVVEILNDNIKLFNGIQEKDEVSDGFICPGWSNVVWKWWTVKRDDKDLELSFKSVKLSDQMISGQIEQLESKIIELKNTHFIEKYDGLFSYEDWDNDDSKNTYEKLMKEINELKNKLTKNSK